MKNEGLAIIGSGATAIYCLKHILDNSATLLNQFQHISIFEKSKNIGYGMPYNPATTDYYNLANISSEEIPLLNQSFADWLRDQSKKDLKKWHITKFPIDDSEVYSRIALGAYFHEQFCLLLEQLKTAGFSIEAFSNHEVLDIEVKEKNKIQLILKNETYHFSRVVIATGHNFTHQDKPKSGYYSTPWPIEKIIPKKDAFYNFEIGLLGASLSAFDVVSSLSHRHGAFSESENGLEFKLHEKAKNFKITLHSAEGWLPHLQYEQEEPFREIYRHTTREELFLLVDKNGFLRIDDFFNAICKPALKTAFKKDANSKMAKLLAKSAFTFKNFIDIMAENHEYVDSFEGMKKEMVQATDSVENDNPIHWMETLDDLMYCLNFHAEMMPAEDHLFFKKEVKSFLMSVIAALPLSSAKILLALYDAEVIDLIDGKVEVMKDANVTNQTQIEISDPDGTTTKKNYTLFINCSGNDQINVDNYPFQSLVKSGLVRKARAKFEAGKNLSELNNTFDTSDVWQNENHLFLDIGGIDVDSAYHIIGEKNTISPHIHDLAFTHTHGCRPYSYGLQACHATSAIMVNSWLNLKNDSKKPKSIDVVSKIYAQDSDL
ncbi:FAD/NAD(P)-binding protein [Bizionia myxarmorum]|uniref:FAD-dependent urate hydroxylase HpyO/Asp monooxygenase CreE-like FAD/NAD(P)-binding domain-containing protein n=1 Tax=Bizionia myxarmorum TaxID=291186 RepID=A0A5D0R2P0_9FLAO|nr:FAD/NAD(P)-binding protein [Bizionia myxarmorum]TYB75833.1 hypothetical protein ES674_13495 [Bizionia myxarmorum]